MIEVCVIWFFFFLYYDIVRFYDLNYIIFINENSGWMVKRECVKWVWNGVWKRMVGKIVVKGKDCGINGVKWYFNVYI